MFFTSSNRGGSWQQFQNSRVYSDAVRPRGSGTSVISIRGMYAPPIIVRSDGRDLAVEDSGPRQGFPILIHSGMGTRHLFPVAVLDAQLAGFRLISYDRPGIGLSHPQPGRRVADSIIDVEAIIDQLHIDRLAVWGTSGGGPYAAATAVGLCDQVSSVCLFAPIGPYGLEEFDFTDGMEVGDEFRQEVKLLLDDPTTARVQFAAQASDMLSCQGSAEWWMGRWGDRAGTDSAHSLEWAKYLADCANDGYGDNGEGWWEDWRATFLPWDVDISGITAPVSLWQGAQDEMVPATHARWYESKLSGMDFHLLEGIDHTNVDEDTRAAALDWSTQFRVTL